jgi:hypothetical protein
MLSPKIVSGRGTVTLGTPHADAGISLAVTQGSRSVRAEWGDYRDGRCKSRVLSLQRSGNGQLRCHATTAGIYSRRQSAGVAQQAGRQPEGNTRNEPQPVRDFDAGELGGNVGDGSDHSVHPDSGTLSSRMVTTDASGNAAVVLTLPGSAGTVHVTAEGPFGLGHPVVTFTETSQ